jgi:hypothetical protein
MRCDTLPLHRAYIDIDRLLEQREGGRTLDDGQIGLVRVENESAAGAMPYRRDVVGSQQGGETEFQEEADERLPPYHH